MSQPQSPDPPAARASGTARRRRSRSRRRAPAGSVPGTLSVPPDAQPLRLRVTRYGPERCAERELGGPEELAPLLEDQGVLWIDAVGLGDGRGLERMGELLGIHPLAIADIVHAPQRPKFEDYGDRYLIVLQMGRPGGHAGLDLEQVTVVLGPNWVATFQERAGDVFEPVRERLRSGRGALRRMGADYLAYALVDAIVDGFFPVLETIGDRLDSLEEQVLASPERESLADVHALRRQLIQLGRILWRQRDAINSMLRDEGSPFAGPVHVYLRDTYDHSVQLLDLVETSRELAVALLEIYLSTASNRMNEVMKTLTVMASIFIPLTFLAGIYGMNFRHMPELEWRFGYPLAWLAMSVIAIGLLLWFQRRGWLPMRSRR